MKKIRIIMFAMFVGALPLATLAGEIAVTSVTAQQRYPWNGLVDLTVTIQGSAEDVVAAGCLFAATNSAMKAAISVEHITQNGEDVGSDNTWTRKFIWDAKADVGAVKIDDVALTVNVGQTSLGGVQLWENGPYWAECNVGASQPEECGYYFWWGDTVGYKRNANDNGWISVKDGTGISFSSGNCPTYGKYNSHLQSVGYIDATGNLVAAHDAATVHLGAPWRMPTDAEFSALIDNCDTEWTSRNGISGRLVKGRGAYASKSIFLPAAGYGIDSYLRNLGSYGFYWSSTPNSDNSHHAWRLLFYSGGIGRSDDGRDYGQSVRPVRGFANVASATTGAALPSVTVNLALDCREGVREVAAEGEELRYDASWYANADSVRLLKNGTVVETGASGIYNWQLEPSCTTRYVFKLEAFVGDQVVTNETAVFEGGEHALDHTGVVDKPAVEPTSSQPGMTAEIKCSRCGEVLQAAEAIPALGYIRNVTARQLWPHKKVEVCYEIAEDIGEVADENAALVLTCGGGMVAPELTFTSDSSYPWTTDSGTRKGSSPSHKSGGYNINNAKSTMCCTVSGATQVSFYWKVSSESNYDKLKFYVDETEKTTAISGNVDWTLVTVTLTSSSSHTLKWSYEKDSSVNSGSDCGWVDCIDVKYANTVVAAKTVLGDTCCVPGLHRVVWDMETDGVSVNQSDAKFVVGYGVVGYGEEMQTVVAPVVKNGTWSSKVATPSSWIASANNALRGVTPTFSGSRYNESGRVSSSDPLSRLSDGVINAKGTSYGNTVGIVSGTLTWTLSKPIDLKKLRINTHWGDGGRDGIKLNSIQIQKSGSSAWETLANSSLSYGLDNDNSGSDLECVFACSEDAFIADNVIAVRFDLGTQDNGGSGFTEFEAVGLPTTGSGVETADGLVHRWSFNGDLIDSVGGQTATTVGSVTSTENQYELAGGSNGSSYISLGSNVLPVDTGAVTIEIWATRNAVKRWARVIDIGSSTENYMFWAWNNSIYSYDTVDYNNKVNISTGGEMSNGTEYLFVIRIEDQSNGSCLVTCSKYNSANGGLLGDITSYTMESRQLVDIGQTSSYLGHSRWSSDSDAAASYNEMRVWNRILSDDELFEHIVSGPDATLASHPRVIDEAKGVSAPTAINTSSSVGDGMEVAGTMTLGYSPIDAQEVEMQIDGVTLLSSALPGEYEWMPVSLGEHTLKHIAGTNVWTRTVNVTALAFATPPAPHPPMAADANVKITQTSHSFTSVAGTYAIPVQGVNGYTGTYTASVSDSSWITINSAEANWKAGRPLVYGVTANDGAEERVGYVYISGHVHTITQAGVGAELSADAADVEMAGGEVEVSVLAADGVKWQVRPNEDWLSVSPTSGTGEGAVTITVAPWNDVSTRSGTVTIAGRTLTVRQRRRCLKLDKIAAEVDWRAQIVNVTVDAPEDVEWSVDELPDWVTVAGEDGEIVRLAIGENPSYVGRSGEVRIGTETLTISQGGRTTDALTFGISPEATVASAKGGDGTVAVTATPDLPWAATSAADWLTVGPDAGEGEGNGGFAYAAAPNPTMAERAGTITVTPEAASGLAAKTLTVRQPAATSQVAETEHMFAGEGESFDVAVSVDEVVGWTVTGGADWISFGSSAMRQGPGKVTIVASANQTINPRETTIVIAGHEFRIVQSGRTVELEYASISFDAEVGGEGVIEVYADEGVQWTASPSDWNWISIWGDDACDYDADGNILDAGVGVVHYYISPPGDGRSHAGWIQIGDKRLNITLKSSASIEVVGDGGAVITGDEETGFTVKPSAGKTHVEISIPDGLDPSKVTVVVGTAVETVMAKGAKVRVVSGGADITEFLNVPAADSNGVIDLTKAMVKEEIVKEALDVEKGAVIELLGGSQGTASPTITTAPTKVGLFYQFREGATLGGMKDGDSTVGDGHPWSPEIKIKGGNSAFYSIGVGKGE